MTEDEWTELINDKLAVFLKKEEKHKAMDHPDDDLYDRYPTDRSFVRE